uniref:Uncharacterized protein n=1 Tax=Magallana gigas TaxID=29159 RepID=K1QHD6_MAGGI
MLSQGVIDWQGRRIPGFRVGMPEKILTVKSSDNYNIPSESEAVIEVELDLDETDEEYNRTN